MPKFNIKATYNQGRRNSEIELDLVSFPESNAVVVYSPALDLSAAGKNFKDAKKSFAIALDEFLRYTISNNTLLVELKRLGWMVKP